VGDWVYVSSLFLVNIGKTNRLMLANVVVSVIYHRKICSFVLLIWLYLLHVGK
jgi:hypothetical protein